MRPGGRELSVFPRLLAVGSRSRATGWWRRRWRMQNRGLFRYPTVEQELDPTAALHKIYERISRS